METSGADVGTDLIDGHWSGVAMTRPPMPVPTSAPT